MCPAQAHLRLLTCSITSRLWTLSFLLPRCYICFFPGMWRLTFFFPSLFVRLLAYSWLGWWVFMLTRHTSLLEIRMSCRLVSPNMFQCYPWRCPGVWWMLPIRLWFFFESICFGFSLWCCICFSCRCSFQRSRLNVVVIYCCVVFHHHICLIFVHLQTLNFTFIS